MRRTLPAGERGAVSAQSSTRSELRIGEYSLPDIKPQTPIAALDCDQAIDQRIQFPIQAVAQAVGLQPTFVRKVVGKKELLSAADVLLLLRQDAFGETLVPRSKVIDHLTKRTSTVSDHFEPDLSSNFVLACQDALDYIRSLRDQSVQCVVTSTPYWGMRIYRSAVITDWADGCSCPYGHEQTPDGFLRHTTEVLSELHRVLTDDGSIWWNVMDTFNTRTQIRENAVEALRAMQGKDKRKWSEHACRRYSAGHAYLKDGEHCLIPSRIAERASRIGFFVKSVITWAKTATLPEPQNSRVSRNLEYVLHLTRVRNPKFHKVRYRRLPATLGGRHDGWETDKLSDVWTLPTSPGRDGHGAQFPVALPGRCIALSTDAQDVVLDPFVGSGNSGVAALTLGRRFIGIDVSKEYLEIARRKLEAVEIDHEQERLHGPPTQIEDTIGRSSTPLLPEPSTPGDDLVLPAMHVDTVHAHQKGS